MRQKELVFCLVLILGISGLCSKKYPQYSKHCNAANTPNTTNIINTAMLSMLLHISAISEKFTQRAHTLATAHNFQKSEIKTKLFC